MAENGTTRGSMMAAIQSAQMAVGSAIAGSAGAVSSPADLEQTSILDKIKEISIDTKEGIQSMAKTMADQFVFDKEKFRREMDARREAEKERLLAASNTDMAMKLPTAEEATGGFGKLALGGIAALVYFAKELNVDEILRLPQQLKSIKAMATFAKGVGTVATLGFGPKIIDNMKSAIKSISLKPKEIKLINDDLLKKAKNMFRPITNIFENIRYQFKLFTMEFRGPIERFKKGIKSAKSVISSIRTAIIGAFTTLQVTFKPLTDTVKAWFGKGGKVAKSIDTILGPLKSVGKFIGRLFLPITLILGVIDGVQGFMKEFGETGSILDGIRGAVTGIVDGFIGGLVRLIGSAVEYILAFFGLENLGAAINEKINLLMDNFLQAIGGITDLITGLFTFDGERIMQGLGAMFSGVGGFFLNILTAPIDMAVNFISDIFSFGDPEKPFSLKKFLLGGDGEPGIVGKVINWFKGLFDFDFQLPSLGDIGRIFTAIAKGGMAAVGALMPGGESPLEAFKRVFDEVANGGQGDTTITNGDNISRVTTENTSGDVTTTTYNTNTINQGPPGMQGTTIVNAPATTVNNQQSSNSNTINSVNLNTSTDRYYDREAWADVSP